MSFFALSSAIGHEIEEQRVDIAIKPKLQSSLSSTETAIIIVLSPTIRG